MGQGARPHLVAERRRDQLLTDELVESRGPVSPVQGNRHPRPIVSGRRICPHPDGHRSAAADGALPRAEDEGEARPALPAGEGEGSAFPLMGHGAPNKAELCWGSRAPHVVGTSPALTRTPGSDQVVPRHPRETVYRCFLPDLTGFTGPSCAGPGRQRRGVRSGPDGAPPRWGIRPRWSGFRVQGTAIAPSSATEIILPALQAPQAHSRCRQLPLPPTGTSPSSPSGVARARARPLSCRLPRPVRR